jgi:hypothetical protein
MFLVMPAAQWTPCINQRRAVGNVPNKEGAACAAG